MEALHQREIQEILIRTFFEHFGGPEEVRLYFAPGRVNLIGEHTDYNGGHVFPCALTLGIYGAARKRTDRILRLYSLNFEEEGVIEADLDTLSPGGGHGWAAYPEGVVWTIAEQGIRLPCGFDLMVYGNLPSGAGLSSSAALEVLTGTVIRDLFEPDKLSMVDIARIGQQAENQYVGMNCGIMDQFASAMGKAGHAIFLDTSTLNYSHILMDLQDAAILITNSRVKHSLVSSAYNDRRRECNEALSDLQKVIPRPDLCLCDLTFEQFAEVQNRIADPVCRRRAKHVISENARTLQAAEALYARDLPAFGRLMNESHISLRDDFEVSCPEIDLLTELAWSIPGVLGSRITGGGFGGCTVSIVKSEAIQHFMETVGTEYERAVGIRPEFYPVQCGEGARRLVP